MPYLPVNPAAWTDDDHAMAQATADATRAQATATRTATWTDAHVSAAADQVAGSWVQLEDTYVAWTCYADDHGLPHDLDVWDTVSGMAHPLAMAMEEAEGIPDEYRVVR